MADGLVQPGEDIPYMPNAIPGQIKVKDINGYTYNEDGTFKTDEHGLPMVLMIIPPLFMHLMLILITQKTADFSLLSAGKLRITAYIT